MLSTPWLSQDAAKASSISVAGRKLPPVAQASCMVLLFLYVACSLWQWQTEGRTAPIGGVRPIVLAASNQPSYVDTGRAAVPGILLLTSGVIFLLLALGFYIAPVVRRRTSAACVVAGLPLLIMGVPAFSGTWTPSREAFAIPPGPLDATLQRCSCVAFYGTVELFPILYSVVSVVSMFVMNFVYAFVKDRVYANCYSTERKGITELTVGSASRPSMPITVATFGYHVFHFGQLAWSGVGYSAVYMTMANSGMLTFVVLGVFGSLVVKAVTDADDGDELKLRALLAFVLLLLTFPGVVRNVLPGMLGWPWLSVPWEFALALLLIVLFPREMCAAQKALSTVWTEDLPKAIKQRDYGDATASILVGSLIWFAFPGTVLTWKACVWLGMVTSDDERTPAQAAPRLTVFLLGIFVLLRTLAYQTYYDISELKYLGVTYFDAPWLSYTARHWRCNACVLGSKIEGLDQAVHAAWLQAFSFIA